MQNHINKLLQRDLDKLSHEISQYAHEADLWLLKPDINNCAGNLCLHLCGNLKHFIGSVLGNSGYVRDRDGEFANKNVPKEELLQNIEETKEIIGKTLPSLSEDILNKDFPVEVLGGPINTGLFLIHLQGHLNYHLGQVNYHRRLLAAKP